MKKFTTWKIWGLWLCCMMLSLALAARTSVVIPDLYDHSENLDSCISGQLALEACDGNQVTLSAPEGCDSYQWNNGSTSATATYTVNDTTTATCLVSTTDCQFTLVATLLTQSGQPTVSSVIYDTICEGEMYTSNYFNLPPQNELGTHAFRNTFYNVNTCSGGSISTTLYLTVQQRYYHIYDTVCAGQNYVAFGNIPLNNLEAGNYTLSRTFQGSNGCDSFVALHLTVNPTYAVSDSMTICASELPYEWNGVVFTEAGTQMDTLQTVNGCDSVVTLFLMVNDTATGIDEQVACDSLTWLDGVTYYASTNTPTYTYYGGAANGCDSVVTLHLTLNYSSHNVLDTSVYETYTWHDSTYVVTGTYTYAYINANGCASVDTLHLTVKYDTHDVYDTVSLCRSELPLMYDTVRIDDAGDYLINLTSSMNTDSIVNLHVIVFENPMPVIEGDLAHCLNAQSVVYVDNSYVSYLWSTGDVNYYTMTSDTVCSVVVTDANGCKGTDTMVFVILPSPEVEVTGNFSMCYQDTSMLRASGAKVYYWTVDGVVYNNVDSLNYVANKENGYIDTIRMRAYSNIGCVTQMEIHIEVFPTYQEVDTVIVCSGELPYHRLDSSYTEAGTYPVHYQSQHGCDSLVMMTLIVKESPDVHILGADSLCADQLSAITASGADSYLWNTQSTALSIVVQPGQSYWLKGTAANGCSTTDSITIRSLSVPVVSIEGPSEACYGDDIVLTATEGYAYHWSDGSSNASLPIHATESGVYQVTAVNVHDCYATASAYVTVYPVYDTSISVICCSNDLPYLYHGHSFNQNGTYEVHLTTIHGCDSVVHLTLTIHESPYAIISGTTEICPGASTQLSANGNGTFGWSTGATRSPITVNTPGWYVLTVTATNGCKAYDSVEVANLPLPNMTIVGDSSICRGSELLLIASGAYSYNWNTGVMGPVLSVTPNQTTSYVVTGTSDRGCTATATHTVVVNAVPTASITGPDAVCQGNTAVFTASGGTQYVWSHGPTTASVQLTSEQLYTVEVSNQAGCTSTASKYLTVNSVPTVSILGQSYFCEGGSSTLNASGIGAISYVWNSTNIGQSYTVTNPGIYTVVATSSANCTASASITVTRRSNPVISVSGNTTFCDGETTQLTASGGQTYMWRNNYGALISNTNTVTLSDGGSYTVIATDEYACSATRPVNVVKKNLPVVSIVASNNEVCEGTTVSLSAGWSSGYAYHWNTGSNNRQIEVTTSGIYVLEVTANGCTAADSVEILVHSLPEIVISGDTIITEGETATVYATAAQAVSYHWNTGSNYNYINVTPATTTYYTVDVTNVYGCSSQKSFRIVVNTTPTIVGNDAICVGDSTLLQAFGGVSYQWNDGVMTASRYVSAPGTYIVTVTNSAGYTATASKTISYFDVPTVSITGEQEICKGENTTLTANSGVSFNWSTGATSQSVTVSPSQNTTYSVTITDQNGCHASASSSVVVHENVQLVISGSDHFCAGDSVVLMASGANQLVWSTGKAGNRLVVYESGDYSVSSSNTDVCVSTATQHVEKYQLPTVSITGPSALCQGESASLTAVANESVTYAWSTGANTNAINVNSTGNYSVTVTNTHACSAQVSKTVTVHELPTVSINAPSSACAGTAVTLNAIGNASQYNWSTGATGSSITINPSSTASYQVTAINEHECSSVASATVVVNPSYDTTIRVSCCSSELPYIYNGQSYYQSGTYVVNLTTTKACDSIIHLVLTVNENPYAIISGNTEICPGGNTQLSASGNGTIRWNTGYDRSPLTVNTPGWYVLTVTATNGCQGVDSVEVTYLPLPNVAINGESSICRGAEVMLMATGASSYNWNTGVTGPVLTVTPQQSSTYMVTGTSDRGCTATTSHTITVNVTPTASISGVDAICQGETAVFTATGGTSYLWSTGATTASVQLTNAQQYTVEVSNQYGCTATATKYLEVNALPTVNIIGQDYFCEGSTTTLSATGTGVVSYLWNNAGVGQSYVVSAPGTYTVQATSPANCTATASISVTQQAVPVASVTGDVSFCDGQSTVLTAAGGQNYSWRNAYGAQIANTASLNLTEGGAYSVVVSDAYGCSASQQVIVTKKNLPNVSIIASDNEVCEGTAVSLNAGWASGYSYQWSTGSTERQITIHSAGTYVLQVTANGCTATDSTTITMHPLPNITFSGDTAICKGNMATVYATAPNASSFLWNTGTAVNNISVLPLVNTNYWVMVEDIYGCRNQDTVMVRVEESPVPTITGPDSICVGASATLVASGGSSYLWDDGSTNAERLVQSAGNYSVTVFTSAGCSATAQKSVYYYAVQEVAISGNTLMCVGDSVLLTAHGVSSYLWSNGSSDDSLLVTAAGIYTVDGWDAHGCMSRDSIEVKERPLPSVEITGNPMACAGSLNLLTAQAPTAVSYLWNTGSTSSQIQVNATAEYSVVVRDANTCQASATFSFQALPVPSCEIMGITNICVGDTTTLTASNGMYFFWSTGSSNQSIQVNPSSTTNYSLVIVDENGCSANTSTQVVVNATVPIVITGNTDFCAGDSVLLVANTHQDLLWSDGQQGDSIYVHETGDYAVHAVDHSTCLLPSTFHVEKHLSPELQIVGEPYLCVGDTGVLYAQTNEAVTYQWTTGSVDSLIRVTSTNVYGVTVTDSYGCSSTASKLLMVYSAPTISVSGPTTLCNGAEAVLTASGTATHFQWSTGDSTASITVNPRYTTTYQVVGSNDYGCSVSASWNLTVAPIPVVTITGDTVLCQGEVTVLTSSNASSFHWSTGSNNRSINVATSGTYTVTVTNSTGCTNSASIYVHVYEYPNLMILGDTMLCQGEQTELLAIGAANYLWSNGSTSPNIVIAPEISTSYTVQAYNGVCMAEATRQVVVNERPTAAITAPDGICDGSVAMLTAQGGVAYLWSTGQTAAMIDVQASGTYQLIAYNQYGCTDTASHILVQYPNPQLQITGPSAICQDAEAVLTAVGNGSFLWNTGDTVTSITITSPGYYSVQVTDLNGCSATTSQNVATLSSPVIVIAGPNDMCADETVSLTAVCANATSFSWNTGVSNNTIQVSPSTTTTYSVTAISVDGCVAQQSHTLAVHPSYLTDFTAEICQGNSYAGYGFSIPVQNVPGEFEFTESLQTAYGCDSIRTLHLTVKPIPVITGNIIGNGEVTSLGNFVYMIDPVENATSYEWILSNPNWSVSYNQTVAQVTITTPGTATLSVYAINDCGQSVPASMQITYGTGIDDAEMSVVKVYPNPNNGMINVQCTMNNAQLFNGELQLFDMYGKMLDRWKMSGENMELDLSSYAAGVYLLKLRNTQTATESVVKVVKQ